jgi:hypothetical protein
MEDQVYKILTLMKDLWKWMKGFVLDRERTGLLAFSKVLVEPVDVPPAVQGIILAILLL